MGGEAETIDLVPSKPTKMIEQSHVIEHSGSGGSLYDHVLLNEQEARFQILLEKVNGSSMLKHGQNHQFTFQL